jgi:hypothetical protein
MVSTGLLRRVALVRTDVSEEPGAFFIRVTKIDELGTTQAATEEPGASFIRVTKIGELGTTQAATSNRRTLRRNTTRRNNPEDIILRNFPHLYLLYAHLIMLSAREPD